MQNVPIDFKRKKNLKEKKRREKKQVKTRKKGNLHQFVHAPLAFDKIFCLCFMETRKIWVSSRVHSRFYFQFGHSNIFQCGHERFSDANKNLTLFVIIKIKKEKENRPSLSNCYVI